MKIRFLPLSFISVFSCSVAIACTCASRGSFKEYAAQSPNVIHARVVRYGPAMQNWQFRKGTRQSMTVEVVDVLKGDLRHAFVTLIGDNGFQCLEYVIASEHVIGEEYLIALHGDEEKQGFGGCGEAWMNVEGELARGRRAGQHGSESYFIPIQELRATLER